MQVIMNYYICKQAQGENIHNHAHTHTHSQGACKYAMIEYKQSALTIV